MKNMSDTLSRMVNNTTADDYNLWQDKIPFIKFPRDWEVKVIPPFHGAVIRFKIKKGLTEVSIYLDCYDTLGCVGEPYWELYPYKNDVFRCSMGDVDDLLKAIKYSLRHNDITKEQKKKKFTNK